MLRVEEGCHTLGLLAAGMVRVVAQPDHCSYKAASRPGALEDCSGENSPKRILGLALAIRLWVPPSHREAQGSHLAVKEETILLQPAQPEMTGKGQVGVLGDA